MIKTDDQLLERPIVIIGAPRSGTTVLGDIFKNHRKLAYLLEPRLTWRWGNDRDSDMLQVTDARENVVNHIRSNFAASVRESGRERLLEKTPSNSLRMPFVDRVLPGCLFVHVIRNGQDSVLSTLKFWQQFSGGVRSDKLIQRLKEISPRQIPYYAREFAKRIFPNSMAGVRVWGPRLPGIEQLVRELGVLPACCLQWRMCVEAACQFGRSLPPTRYLECRLEDMCDDLIRQVHDFCELEQDPAVWDYFEKNYDPTMTGARRADATEEELETIRRWIEPTMQWLGYSN
jgi:hypothetical protein